MDTNDKVLVVGAIVIIAILATFAATMIDKIEKIDILLTFFATLASGLFGLVTGMAIEKVKDMKKAHSDG